MRRSAVPALLAGLVVAASVGCAHDKANQYAFAPPLAPPVYSQPQMAAQPVVAAGTVVAAPVVPGAVVAPTAPVAAGAPIAAGGVVPANADGSCPPCAGGAAAVPVVYETAVQTTPCPQ